MEKRLHLQMLRLRKSSFGLRLLENFDCLKVAIFEVQGGSRDPPFIF